MNIFIVRCAVVGYIRPNSVLVVCCGLLAKWLRVIGLGQGQGNALTVLLFFFVLWSYKCGEHLCVRWFGSLCKYAPSYLRYVSCHMVSHFHSSDRVKEVSPFGDAEETYFRACINTCQRCQSREHSVILDRW